MNKNNCVHLLDWIKLQWLCSLQVSGHKLIAICNEGNMEKKLSGPEVAGVIMMPLQITLSSMTY